MISIDRSIAQAPHELVINGRLDINRIRDLVSAGTLTSKEFKKSIYASDAVRDSLWALQHHKCCFCEHVYERKFSTVEHFRPKTSSRNENGLKEQGYWWLAYEFNNLYFCCSNCNTPKSDWFPLGSDGRYQPGQLPWNETWEDPLILDPGSPITNPAEHLCFVRNPVNKRWRIAAIDRYGEWTIRAAKLDRDDLNELRDKHHDTYLLPIIKSVEKDATHWDLARRIARHYSAPQSSFALLTKTVFSEVGLI